MPCTGPCLANCVAKKGTLVWEGSFLTRIDAVRYSRSILSVSWRKRPRLTFAGCVGRRGALRLRLRLGHVEGHKHSQEVRGSEAGQARWRTQGVRDGGRRGARESESGQARWEMQGVRGNIVEQQQESPTLDSDSWLKNLWLPH